ncbi:DUF2793 domain-containing protein [Kaistia geumhonensis]|uniref:DUF2793 domain-containing protein n=1 Tax=Kaistia geumhonensis TaxID=410839 RepID=A0ABU0M5V3_9HYPH|nr:DUF2793 domain-containing protein [Kaistia geumhonensis]MCX5478443.1 DUF2793 domain-containing protein [Kaistia geumhonensis]MDQ0516339.1 hypothetical protein [Kaistia geumhonensis]
MSESARLKLPYLAASQAQKHVTHNEALTILDALVSARALDKDTASPPGGASDGDAYIVPVGATGAWSGWDNSFAERQDGIWRRFLPFDGLIVWVSDESRQYRWNATASAWQAFGELRPARNGSGTTDALALTDLGKQVILTNGSAITLTLPNSLPVGFQCIVIQGGAGAVTFSPASGASLKNRNSHTKTSGLDALVTVLVRANSGGSSAVFHIAGDTAA